MTHLALKEWSAVETLLAEGAVSVLVRKGGVVERGDGFEVERRSFWIFPTLYHQNPPELRTEHRGVLGRGDLLRPAGGRIPLRLHATVEAWARVEDEARLPVLRPLHPYADSTVEARFRYRGKPYLHALLLRVRALPKPARVPRDPAYYGCTSWVELREPVSAEAAAPVLDDAAFAGVRTRFLEAVGEAVG